MTRQEAFAMLAPGLEGPDAIHAVAAACHISYQAVAKWPDEVGPLLNDRVTMAYYRMHVPSLPAVPVFVPRVENPFRNPTRVRRAKKTSKSPIEA